MASRPQQGDWSELRALILAELQRLNAGIEAIKVDMKVLHGTDIAKLTADIAVLKFKSGVWGLVAGLIPSAIAVVYVIFRK